MHPWSPVVRALYMYTGSPWWAMKTWWDTLAKTCDQTQPLLQPMPLTVEVMKANVPIEKQTAIEGGGGGQVLLKILEHWNNHFSEVLAASQHASPYWSCTYWDDEFPFRLRAIPDPPTVIWSTKPFPWLSQVPVMAVVGSRKMSDYGRWATKTFVRDLVERYGYGIVSGCALGVDELAHQTALDCGGMTVGWIASGLSNAPPTINARFAPYDCAAIVSEYPPSITVQKWRYAVRNRLIAGLADAVLVVEAGEHSGTLITAHAAAEQGREVFVVPQSLWGRNVASSIHLVNEGALLVGSAQEIHEWLEVGGDRQRPPHSVSTILELWTVARLRAKGWQEELVLLATACAVVRWLQERQGACLSDAVRLIFPMADESWWRITGELERLQIASEVRGVLTLSDMIQS